MKFKVVLHLVLSLTLINVCICTETEKSEEVKTGVKKNAKQEEEALDENLTGGFINFFRKRGLSESSAAKKGQALYDKGNYQEALTLFSIAIEKNGSVSNYISRGKCYVKLGRLEEAASDFELAATRIYQTSETQKLVIEAIYDFEECDQLAAKIESVKAFHLAARGYEECTKKQTERALRLYNGAILKERCEEHYLARAVCYVKMGKLDEARSDWELGKRCHKYYKDLVLGPWICADMGLNKGNKAIVEDLVKSGVCNADLEGKCLFDHADFAQVGSDLFAAERFKGAIPFFNAAIMIESHSEYYKQRGDCYEKLEQEALALKDHEKASQMEILRENLPSTNISAEQETD